MRDFISGEIVEEILHQKIDKGEYVWKRHPWTVEFMHNFQIKAALTFVPQECQIRGTEFIKIVHKVLKRKADQVVS